MAMGAKRISCGCRMTRGSMISVFTKVAPSQKRRAPASSVAAVGPTQHLLWPRPGDSYTAFHHPVLRPRAGSPPTVPYLRIGEVLGPAPKQHLQDLCRGADCQPRERLFGVRRDVRRENNVVQAYERVCGGE